MPNAIFLTFLDPSNTVGRLLIAHFIAFQVLLSPIIEKEWYQNREKAKQPLLSWILGIARETEKGERSEEVKRSIRRAAEWPVRMAKTVAFEMRFEGFE